MKFSDIDNQFMQLAFLEAQKGTGYVSPNPLVGAIIVKENEIIGRGHHQKYGGAHAEVNAINDAISKGHNLKNASMYVTLEPCSHTNKKTPPCAPQLINSGIKKVFISNIDPNPNVSGNGIKLLNENNVNVILADGEIQKTGEEINETFFHVMNIHRPFVHLKMGMSLDGKIATASGDSKYITGIESRENVHYLRQKYDAIVIGKNTLLQDNPELTVRLSLNATSHPLRIVFIDLPSIKFDLKLFSDIYKKNTIVITTDRDIQNNKEIVYKIEGLGISLLGLKEITDGRVDLNSFMITLYSLKIHSLLLEGGAILANQFIKANLVDKVSFYYAPIILGGIRSGITDIGVDSLQEKILLKNVKTNFLGKDILVEGNLCSQV
jgi:diaminohydroxyphosphoribosylaminopyrimidine deaminase/5-amino-6-(5-phosphoribosylamino)uracil reductase